MRTLKFSPSLADQPEPDDDRCLSLAELCQEVLNISLSTGNRLKALGRLPPCLRLSAGAHRWRMSTVRAWMNEQEQANA